MHSAKQYPPERLMLVFIRALTGRHIGLLSSRTNLGNACSAPGKMLLLLLLQLFPAQVLWCRLLLSCNILTCLQALARATSTPC
jgi:hypothetical protein